MTTEKELLKYYNKGQFNSYTNTKAYKQLLRAFIVGVFISFSCVSLRSAHDLFPQWGIGPYNNLIVLIAMGSVVYSVSIFYIMHYKSKQFKSQESKDSDSVAFLNQFFVKYAKQYFTAIDYAKEILSDKIEILKDQKWKLEGSILVAFGFLMLSQLIQRILELFKDVKTIKETAINVVLLVITVIVYYYIYFIIYSYTNKKYDERILRLKKLKHTLSIAKLNAL